MAYVDTNRKVKHITVKENTVTGHRRSNHTDDTKTDVRCVAG